MTLFSLLKNSAQRWPEREAVFEGQHAVHTWASLHTRALQLAHALAERGTVGSRVAIASLNCPEYVELMFGSWGAGHAVVPINAKLHPKEMAAIVSDADPACIFVSAELAPALAPALDASAQAKTIVIGSASYQDLFASPAAHALQVAPDALAWLFYTSGTTGRSKGAMLSHRNLMAMTVSHLADVEPSTERDTQIHAAPMSHGSGLYIPAYVARGTRQVIPASRGFDPAEFLDLCEHHVGCSAFLAPTMVQRLRAAVQQRGEPPSGLRTIIYGGGPMYLDELKQSLLAFGKVFIQIYGQGEAPMTITWLAREAHAGSDDAILGSVGTARTGVQVRVADTEGQDMPPGQTGEILVRGDVVMMGYWRNPQSTAAAIRDGWLWTGDMGSLDGQGFLTLRDRSKDVVISGGSNVYPREVEEVLLAHPGVDEVCVVGQADPEWGEVVVAFVVTAPGATVTSKHLDAACLQRLARFKRPKHYHFVPSLPKNNYGKVLKRALRAQLEQPSHQENAT